MSCRKNTSGMLRYSAPVSSAFPRYDTSHQTLSLANSVRQHKCVDCHKISSVCDCVPALYHWALVLSRETKPSFLSDPSWRSAVLSGSSSDTARYQPLHVKFAVSSSDYPVCTRPAHFIFLNTCFNSLYFLVIVDLWACTRLTQYRYTQIYREFLKILSLMEACLQICVFTVFAFHTHSRISSTASKLICVAQMSSELPPFCITLWIVDAVSHLLTATTAIWSTRHTTYSQIKFHSRHQYVYIYYFIKCSYIFEILCSCICTSVAQGHSS
jgi:hypothetical protein